MYKTIVVPVDLSHLDELEKALTTAADLARHYDASLAYVGVTSNLPGPEAHSPEEFAAKLDAFAARQSEGHGRPAAAHAYTSHDPSIELERILVNAAQELNADLIVMATHAPGLLEGLREHHGAHIAARTEVSILLVR